MVILDSSVIIKGLIRPRRKKDDEIFREQARIHKIAAGFMEDITAGKQRLIIPTVGLFECACVAARMTGRKNVGVEIADYVFGISSEIISEASIKDRCIHIAATTQSSGFDSLFITCAEITNSFLITDDKGMYEAALKQGIKTKLLRDMG